jgi:hypothetical protein
MGEPWRSMETLQRLEHWQDKAHRRLLMFHVSLAINCALAFLVAVYASR